MKASSAFVVLLGIAAGAACAGTTIAAAQGAGNGAVDPAAMPGTCGEAIARLESALNESLARGRPLRAAPESVSAMLHHQPSRDSVAKAQSESVKRVEDALATARELRAAGRRAECVSMLSKIALSVGIR